MLGGAVGPLAGDRCRRRVPEPRRDRRRGAARGRSAGAAPHQPGRLGSPQHGSAARDHADRRVSRQRLRTRARVSRRAAGPPRGSGGWHGGAAHRVAGGAARPDRRVRAPALCARHGPATVACAAVRARVVRPKRCNGGAPRGARRGVRRGPEHRRGRRPGLAHARRRLADALRPAGQRRARAPDRAARLVPAARLLQLLGRAAAPAPPHPASGDVPDTTRRDRLEHRAARAPGADRGARRCPRGPPSQRRWRRGFRAPHGWR